MNIELVNELKKYVQEGNKEIAEIKAEYEELTSLTHDQTREDIKRIKEIRKTVAAKAERISNIEEDLNVYEEIADELKEANVALKDLKNETRIKIIKSYRDSKSDELAAKEEEMKAKYADILKEVIIAQDPENEVKPDEENEVDENENEVEEEKSVNAKHVVIGGVSIVAAIAAIAILANAAAKKNDKQPTSTDDAPTKTVTTVNTPSPTTTSGITIIDSNSTEVKAEGFTDINDSDAVAKRAEEVYNEIVKNNPGYAISVSDIENMILWFNGGVVENPTVEDRDAMLNIYLDLLGRDAYEANAQFDFTKLFLDGSRAQKAAQESFEVRKDILANLGTDKVNESADKLAELFAKSMNGLNGAQSFNTIETKMGKAAILLANVYNYATADFDRAAIYTDENGFTYDLSEMIAAVNTDCLYEDELEMKTVDLLTSLLNGAVLDARDLKESKGLSLTK